jgi:hypothetical protein
MPMPVIAGCAGAGVAGRLSGLMAADLRGAGIGGALRKLSFDRLRTNGGVDAPCSRRNQSVRAELVEA